MVSPQAVQKQLKKLGFNAHGWGRSEVKELPHILVPDEEIYELANGYYEAGFALLVATNIRVLLVDRKPLNYLTVEDLRFDMINEIDYSHRLLGARIKITTGSKVLNFTSYNQPRLRKLINHVQDCMAEIKMKQSQHQEGQVTHLEKLNEQLQSYMREQQKYQEKLHEQLQQAQTDKTMPMPLPEQVRPAPELSDYLYAKSLLAQHEQQREGTEKEGSANPESAESSVSEPAYSQSEPVGPPPQGDRHNPQMDELYDEAIREVFGRHMQHDQAAPKPAPNASTPVPTKLGSSGGIHLPIHLDPLRVAYSKLPMALRNRRFGRPSYHAHSQHKPLPDTH